MVQEDKQWTKHGSSVGKKLLCILRDHINQEKQVMTKLQTCKL